MTMFNEYEENIIKLLGRYRMPFTAYEVAKETDMAYPTARKYFRKLRSEGVIQNHKMQNLRTNKKTKVYELVPELLQEANE